VTPHRRCIGVRVCSYSSRSDDRSSHYSFLASSSGRHRISYRHPACKRGDDVLFTLYARDHEEGGIHHGLAHTACAIIAGNRHDGYLLQLREGIPVAAGMDDVLPHGDLFFHVPQTRYANATLCLCSSSTSVNSNVCDSGPILTALENKLSTGQRSRS